MNTQIISEDARKVLVEGTKRLWFPNVVGQGECPKEPTYKDGWWYVPLNEDAKIPKEGLVRLNTLKTLGIRIDGVIVAHEAPKLLTVEKKKKDFKISPLLFILPILAPLASVLLLPLLLVLPLMVALPVVALIDPALIIILKDGTWIEVMTWLE